MSKKVQSGLKGKSKMASKAWTSCFPSSVETEVESLTFVKKLVAIGVSNIIYLRGKLPDSAFQSHDLDGLNLKILKNEAGAEGAELCKWVADAMDAVEKRLVILKIENL